MDTFHQILLKYWGFSHFRPMQEEIIHSIAEGNDTLGLMPTGGGKSVTFQVPAMAEEGLCIVVTPLIALMRDQVENLKRREIKALAVYSGMTREEIDITLDNAIYGDFKFLYCSPERLGTEMFRVRVQKMQVSFIVVDEAHCISQWGYDFRPSYLRIAELREFLPDVPILALTATATPEVAEDIMQNLRFRSRNLFRMSFERKNLVYIVRHVEDKQGYLLRLAEHIQGSGIVYVRNRLRTREVAEYLERNGISADFYHAGLSDEVRHARENDWKTGKTRIIVATNAFGMGIDKPDVRFVVHLDLPDSVEAYFQEAGRGGRDEKKSFAVLLYHPSDKQNAQKRIATNFPEIPVIREVYNALGSYFQIPLGGGKGQSFDFNLFDFCSRYKIHNLVAFNCLKVLEQEGYIELSDDLNIPAQLHFLVERDDLYKFQVANVQFDDFIKLVLRSYSGLFSGYVAIDEDILAKRAKLTRDNVYQYLLNLQKQKILHYIPRRQNPVIIYTEERLEDKALFISHQGYNQRKVKYQQRLEAMIEYAESDTRCRSQMLLRYFGETSAERCGQCDVCDRRNELNLSRYEFDLILERIRKALLNQPCNLRSLIDENSGLFTEEKTLAVVQWLIDHHKIEYDNNSLLKWNKE